MSTSLITMLLGGLWHGAAWTFVIWGALHGAYLCINHAWNKFGPKVAPRFARAAGIVAFMLTFLCVVVAWVFFRADSLPSAINILSKMADPATIAFGRLEIAQTAFIAVYAAIAWFAPNTQTIMGYDHRIGPWGEGLKRGRCARFPLHNRRRAGVRDSRNPAAQRIHLFQVLMSNPAPDICRDFWARRGPHDCLGRRCSISRSIPCSCSGRRGCLRRCIRRMPACKMPA